MILTDKEIRDRVINCFDYNENYPLIENFNEDSLQSVSYDLSITNKIYVLKEPAQHLALNDQETIDKIYKEVDITSGYTLKPSEYILVTLYEIINMPKDLIAHIRPRTTFVRLGLLLHFQHLNPTYRGRLRLGLYNAAPYSIEILPRIKIGQIVFEKLINIPSKEKWYSNIKDSKYQDENDFVSPKLSDELNHKIEIEYKKLMDDLLNGDE